MPISFFVYMLGVFGYMVSVITANHILDTFDFIHSDWMDQLAMVYFGGTLLFVCWWGITRRLEVTMVCLILQPFVGLAIHVMSRVPDLHTAEELVNSSPTGMFVAVFLMTIIFLLVHGLGNVIRLIAEFIVSMGRRHSCT